MAISILLIAVILLATCIYLFSGRRTQEQKIPGLQPTNSQTGNIPDIDAAGSMHEFLVNLHKKHGKIASFWLGIKYYVSVASPESFKALGGVRDRPLELFELFKPIFGADSVVYMGGMEHKLRRGATDKMFGHEQLPQFCEIFNKIAKDTITRLSSLPPNDDIPLTEYTRSLVIKAVTESSFGDSSQFQDDKNCDNFLKYYEVCWDDMALRTAGDMPEEGSERLRKFEEALGGMKDIIKKIVLMRKENPPPQQEMKFIDVLMENEDMFPEETILQESLSYVIAAYHTSGYLLAWMLYFLALNPEAEERVYQEIIDVVGEEDCISPGNVGDLKYLKQALNETLRLSVLAPWGARIVDEDITLEGYLVKKMTPIVIPFGVLHEDETIWPNVTKFDPDRFNPENVKERHPYAFHPFGLPARICPGYRYAYYQATVFLAQLIREFKWSLVEGQEINRLYGFVTYPDKEMWMRITPRV